MESDVLGPLERRVMEQLWTRGPQAVANILDALNARSERKLAYTTIMTILVRLHEKQYVLRAQTGRTFTYRAAMDEPTLVAMLGRRELNRLIERYGAASLARFAGDLSTASPALTERLGQLAEDDLQ